MTIFLIIVKALKEPCQHQSLISSEHSMLSLERNPSPSDFLLSIDFWQGQHMFLPIHVHGVQKFSYHFCIL